MNSLIRRLSAASLALGISFVGAAQSKADTRLTGAGATFPAPIYQKWISEYQKAHPDAKIDYTANGSGAGIKSITDKTVDFGASDAPMTEAELKKAEDVVQIPTVAGAVVLAYNLPGFEGDLKLDGDTLADIYLGKIKKWNDPKIVALNSGTSLPDVGITTAHRTDGSGTNFVFTSYLSTQSDEFTEKVGAGKTVDWPGGQGGAQNNGVAAIVQGTKGSIGYVELAYALHNKMPFATMKNRDGAFVKATPASISAAGEGALKKMEGKLAVNIWNQPGAESYPISSFTYLLIHRNMDHLKSAEKATTLVEFVAWATSEGEKLAPDLDYAPLSAGVQKKVADAIGTLTYEGKAVRMASGQ